jgi:hypothetical protein
MEYILLIYKDSDSVAASGQRNGFFVAENENGVFLGGSKISNQI